MHGLIDFAEMTYVATMTPVRYYKVEMSSQALIFTLCNKGGGLVCS